MKFGDRPLQLNTMGKDVEELQLRLAGFKGTLWDGQFGPKTKKQVVVFQKDFMKAANPSGKVDGATFAALDAFAAQFPIAFEEPLKCTQCSKSDGAFCTREGFGQKRFKGTYLKSRSPIRLDWSRLNQKANSESRHQYEYPGIHKAVLQTFRAFRFYAAKAGFPEPLITSGYRCHINNVRRNRTSTNHMGKAIDFSFTGLNQDDLHQVCEKARRLLVNKCGCQIRWRTQNKKALEPGVQELPGEFTAKTWVHLDVRQYDRKYLADRFFIDQATTIDEKIIN